MSDIDIRETVPLADLVPVVLSDAERAGLVKSEIDALNSLKIEITERLTTLDEPGVVEKVTEALEQIDALILQSSVAIDTGEIETAETTSKDARVIMTDIDVLTQKDEEATVDPVVTPDTPVSTEPVSTTTEDGTPDIE